jgi:hypothetical protein
MLGSGSTAGVPLQEVSNNESATNKEVPAKLRIPFNLCACRAFIFAEEVPTWRNSFFSMWLIMYGQADNWEPLTIHTYLFRPNVLALPA